MPAMAQESSPPSSCWQGRGGRTGARLCRPTESSFTDRSRLTIIWVQTCERCSKFVRLLKVSEYWRAPAIFLYRKRRSRQDHRLLRLRRQGGAGPATKICSAYFHRSGPLHCRYFSGAPRRRSPTGSAARPRPAVSVADQRPKTVRGVFKATTRSYSLGDRIRHIFLATGNRAAARYNLARHGGSFGAAGAARFVGVAP